MIAKVQIDIRIRIICIKSNQVKSNPLYKKLRNGFDLANSKLNREISKLNYRIHTDAIKGNLFPTELTPAQMAYTYANEAKIKNELMELLLKLAGFAKIRNG